MDAFHLLRHISAYLGGAYKRATFSTLAIVDNQAWPVPTYKPARPRHLFLALWQEIALLGQGASGITHIPPTLICLFDMCSAPRHPCILLL